MHNLCFFIVFFSKITFYWKLFSDCCNLFCYPDPLYTCLVFRNFCFLKYPAPFPIHYMTPNFQSYLQLYQFALINLSTLLRHIFVLDLIMSIFEISLQVFFRFLDLKISILIFSWILGLNDTHRTCPLFLV